MCIIWRLDKISISLSVSFFFDIIVFCREKMSKFLTFDNRFACSSVISVNQSSDNFLTFDNRFACSSVISVNQSRHNSSMLDNHFACSSVNFVNHSRDSLLSFHKLFACSSVNLLMCNIRFTGAHLETSNNVSTTNCTCASVIFSSNRIDCLLLYNFLILSTISESVIPSFSYSVSSLKFSFRSSINGDFAFFSRIACVSVNFSNPNKYKTLTSHNFIAWNSVTSSNQFRYRIGICDKDFACSSVIFFNQLRSKHLHHDKDLACQSFIFFNQLRSKYSECPKNLACSSDISSNQLRSKHLICDKHFACSSVIIFKELRRRRTFFFSGCWYLNRSTIHWTSLFVSVSFLRNSSYFSFQSKTLVRAEFICHLWFLLKLAPFSWLWDFSVLSIFYYIIINIRFILYSKKFFCQICWQFFEGFLIKML